MSEILRNSAAVASVVRRTFVEFTSPWTFGFRSEELEVSSRDTEEVMRRLPEDVICFRFYDRLVAQVQIDGQPLRMRSERLDFSEARYFVDVDRTYSRSEVQGWWRQSSRQHCIREAMKRWDTDYAATWGKRKPPYCVLGYRPGLDVTLARH